MAKLKRETVNIKCVEPFEIGSKKEIGERQLDFSEENILVKTNSFLQMGTGHRKSQGK